MSRTYKKVIRSGNCTGSNTEYYRNKRRAYRSKWKMNLIKAINNPKTILGYADPRYDISIDDIYVHPEKTIKFKDDWVEPTDGSWLLNDYCIRYWQTAAKSEPYYADWYNECLRRAKIHLKKYRIKKWR